MINQTYTQAISRSLQRGKNTHVSFSGILLVLLTLSLRVSAQNDIEVNDVVVGSAEVSAPGSVILKPGFSTVEGSNFRAYIGPKQTSQSVAATINSTTGTTPASGASGQNYIKTITYREAETSVPTGDFKHNEIIQYFDGLGRPIQTVGVGASPNGNDVIQPVLYDAFGREAIKTLPYVAGKTGEFRAGVTEATVNNYYRAGGYPPKNMTGDDRAYTQITYDNSPLNRVVSQSGPGERWASKPVKTNYLTNDASKTGWTVNAAGTFSSVSYPANSLYVTETVDEDRNKTREYKDKQGKVLFKESYNGGWARTAYIYDDLDLLRCVVPPLATGPADVNLCYFYTYDDRNRMIAKTIPGAGPTTMVYDERDRLRCTRNAIQASAGEWSFIKYDELNRPVITGTVAYSGNIQTEIDASLNESREATATNYGYTNNTFPSSGAGVLTVTWYDNYDFTGISGLGISDSLHSEHFDAGTYNMATKKVGAPKGRVTGTMTRVLSASTDASAVPKSTLYTAMYYDKYGNVLRTISDNHLGGKDVVSNLYDDITLQLTQSKQEHYKGAEHLAIEKTFEYDHTGRLLATRAKVNDQPEITESALKYNEVGQMITKYLHSKEISGSRSFVLNASYYYNIRGWLTGIGGNNLFGMKLCYNDTSGMGGLAPGDGLYNGNIVGMRWTIKNDKTRGYHLMYDGLNRLHYARYAEGSHLDEHNYYFDEELNYDLNGNITSIRRMYNNTMADLLSYSYIANTNQVKKITDNGTAVSAIDDYPGTSGNYTYDANGNMNHDGGKNIDIAYQNLLNLPQSVDFGSNNKIFYHYTAGGAKLVKHIRPSGGTDSYTHYIGNIVYEGGKLSYITTGEGRLVPYGEGANRKFLHEYNLRDHLGNNRVTFMGSRLGGAVDIVQTTSYYPFGLVMNQFNGNTATDYQKNKYLYNGKELQDDNLNGTFFGLYDYGFRFYDPQIARWTTLDPLAQKYYQLSPYVYVANNPLKFIDPDGKKIIFIIRNDNGNVTNQLTYRNGNFWHENGKRYNPQKESLSTDLYRTLAAYRQVEKSGDKVLTHQLKTLETSDKNHYVEAPTEKGTGSSVKAYENGKTVSETEKMTKNGTPVGTQTVLDFSLESKIDFQKTEGVEKTDLSTVTHEMQHQYDYDQGTMTDDVVDSNSAKDPSEIRAVNNENRGRKIEGDDKRTIYGGEKIDPEKLY